MTNKEIQDILDELNTVRLEKLNKEAKRLYEAIMTIADERDKYKSIVEKASKDLNITPEMLIAEFDRLEDLEDDREKLKWRLKEEREKVENQQKEIEELNNQIIELQQQKIVDKNSIKQQDNFFDYYNYIHKDKIRDEIEFLKKPREVTLINAKGKAEKVMYEEIYNDTIKVLEKMLEE